MGVVPPTYWKPTTFGPETTLISVAGHGNSTQEESDIFRNITISLTVSSRISLSLSQQLLRLQSIPVYPFDFFTRHPPSFLDNSTIHQRPTDPNKAMAKQELNRGVRIYHSVVSIVLLLLGFAFVALGLWLSSTDSNGLTDLDFEGESLFKIFLNLHWASVLVGGFLILSAIFSLISLGRNCIGATFRTVYAVLGLFIFIVLLATCFLSIMLLRNKYNNDIRAFVENAWNATYKKQPDALCDIERRLQCRGFDYWNCKECDHGADPSCDFDLTACASCVAEAAPSDGYYAPGCYDQILEFLSTILLPIAIVSGVFSVGMMVDLLSICFL